MKQVSTNLFALSRSFCAFGFVCVENAASSVNVFFGAVGSIVSVGLELFGIKRHPTRLQKLETIGGQVCALQGLRP